MQKGIRALDCAEAGNYKECVKLIQSAILVRHATFTLYNVLKLYN